MRNTEKIKYGQWKVPERENYLQVTWIHMRRELLELAIIVAKDNCKPDEILGSTILEDRLGAQ